jgi:integrase
MLSTACRIGEISSAQWVDVDLENATWQIPAEHSKNGKPHLVNLSLFAVGQFNEIKNRQQELAKRKKEENKKEECEQKWVFPATQKENISVDPKSLTKQIADRQRGNAAAMKKRSPLTNSLTLSGGKWTPHDLRRTGATLMATLGVRPDVIEKCLNHTEQNKIMRIYQRSELRPEMQSAWKLLGERLELLTQQTDNVIILPNTKAA